MRKFLNPKWIRPSYRVGPSAFYVESFTHFALHDPPNPNHELAEVITLCKKGNGQFSGESAESSSVVKAQ